MGVELVHVAKIGEQKHLFGGGGLFHKHNTIQPGKAFRRRGAVAAPEGVGLHALYIAVASRHNHRFLHHNEVLSLELLNRCRLYDDRAAGIGVILFDLQQFLFDDRHKLFVRIQYGMQLLDELLHLFKLLLQLDNLQRGQPGQPHVEDGLRLHACQLEGRHQVLLGICNGFAVADDAHNLVDVVDGDEQPL